MEEVIKSKEEIFEELEKLEREYIDLLYDCSARIRNIKLLIGSEESETDKVYIRNILRSIVYKKSQLLNDHRFLPEREYDLWKDLSVFYEKD